MYKTIIRPILFLFSPEVVHYLVVKAIKTGFLIPGIRSLVQHAFTCRSSLLERQVFGIRFSNPIGLAAGFDKNAESYKNLSAFGFSFIEIGTVTPKPQPGNPKPRSFRLKKDSALINRMGFNNKGVLYVKGMLKRSRGNVIIGGNIGKNTATPNHLAIDDYIMCFKELYQVVDYFVVNVSCPNITDLKELQDKEKLGEILHELTSLRSKEESYKPILLKVSPDLTNLQLAESVETARRAGLDGFVATNTTTSRECLVTDNLKVNAIGNGGLSGFPLRERSTEIIRLIHQQTNGSMPIIGSGGIMSPEDALEKINAGASLVQLYTGFIYEGPGLAKRICKKILMNQG